MDVRMERKPSLKIIGMTLSVLLQVERKHKLITKLHDQFDKRIHEIKAKKSPTFVYGIFIDPPNYQYETDEFTWVAGVEVDNLSEVPENMAGYEFPENLYAITTYKGPKGEAGHIYDALYNWIEESEYSLADTYGLEIYSENEDEENMIIMDLCFPILKK
ncbi:GyrI-like domain-containing protein [Cytobacillus sp.]|uniref:GyrI-like domain-containing protein n=1 Tax=Cytobacillus sp. TaxID=2675269 RepID=UPI0028BE972B|nr:GyrI-like domain-containing protein [Cytobacillus sp.]